MVMAIPLTKGKKALVDDEDYGWLMRLGLWYAHPVHDSWYAERSVPSDVGHQNSVRMHIVIMGKTLERTIKYVKERARWARKANDENERLALPISDEDDFPEGRRITVSGTVVDSMGFDVGVKIDGFPGLHWASRKRVRELTAAADERLALPIGDEIYETPAVLLQDLDVVRRHIDNSSWPNKPLCRGLVARIDAAEARLALLEKALRQLAAYGVECDCHKTVREIAAAALDAAKEAGA